jgi:hypothetical protein
VWVWKEKIVNFFLEGLKKNTEPAFRIAGVEVDIRIKHFSNTRLSITTTLTRSIFLEFIGYEAW